MQYDILQSGLPYVFQEHLNQAVLKAALQCHSKVPTPLKGCCEQINPVGGRNVFASLSTVT